MAYSTQADVQSACGGLARLKQLVDWDNDGAVDQPMVLDAIAEADALIDSYASKRFSVPFAPVPETVRRASASIAKLKLAKRRRVLTATEQDEWDELCSTDQRKQGWLYLLATGVVTPGGDPLPLQHSTMQPDEADNTLPCDRDVSRDKLGGFW